MKGVVALFPILALLTGCGGAGEPTPEPVAAETAFSEERIAETWVVKMATEQELAPYASPPWATLVMRRDYRKAGVELAPAGGLPVARVHAELAALYRQAALLSANSVVQTYGLTPDPADPLGTAHLLTVGYALLGDLDAARAAAARLEGVADDPTGPWHAPWASWLAAGAAWPPDLTDLPFELGPPEAGGWPTVGQLPHYSLQERSGSASERPMGDPGALVALFLWHDAAAAAAAGPQAEAVAAYRAGYRLPVEPPVPGGGPLPMDLLFGSDLLVPGDAALLAEVHGPTGLAALEAHRDRSLLAAVALASRVDGHIDAERASDVLAGLRAQMVAAAGARTGAPQSHQRQFADVAVVGTLRNLAILAGLEGDKEASGLLRIQAMERSIKATGCPVGLLALGAWDAGNRYPLRALDILHAEARRFPSLETARYGLDAMALRVSREQTGQGAGM